MRREERRASTQISKDAVLTDDVLHAAWNAAGIVADSRPTHQRRDVLAWEPHSSSLETKVAGIPNLSVVHSDFLVRPARATDAQGFHALGVLCGDT